MRRKVASGRCHRLVGVFNLFMAYHPKGLGCFLDESIPFPTMRELAEMVSSPCEDPGTRIDHKNTLTYEQRLIEKAEPIQRVIAENGGLDHIRRGFALYREHEPEDIKLLNDLVQIGLRFESLQAVAKAHKMPPDMVRRHKDRALERLAQEIEIMRYS